MNKVSNDGRLLNKNDQIIVEKGEKIDTYKNCIEELFKDGNRSE